MPARKKQVNINLIVSDELGESFPGQLLSWILTYGRYIIIITQIVVLSVFFLRFKVDRDYTDLKEAVSQKQALVESIADLENDIKRIQERLGNIQKITKTQELFPKIMQYLQDHIPADTTFESLTLNTESITFVASSGGLSSFSVILQQIQQENKFKEITLEEISRKPDGRVTYKIKAKVNSSEFK